MFQMHCATLQVDLPVIYACVRMHLLFEQRTPFIILCMHVLPAAGST